MLCLYENSGARELSAPTPGLSNYISIVSWFLNSYRFLVEKSLSDVAGSHDQNNHHTHT